MTSVVVPACTAGTFFMGKATSVAMRVHNEVIYHYDISKQSIGGAVMSIDHAILGVISWYPASGYDIKMEFEHGGPGLVWGMSFGSIYPRLEKLEADGFIKTHEAKTEGRERKTYELTAKGWGELSRWLAKPSAYPLPWRDELLLKMGFWGTALPEDRSTSIQQLRVRQTRSRELLQHLTEWPQNGESAIDEYGMLVITYARMHLDADLAWIDTAIAQLEGPPQPPVQDPHGLFARSHERRTDASREVGEDA
jgi:PadR family transcriptional regulator AphA